MSEVLKPYPDCNQYELATALQRETESNRKILERRNLGGDIERYGSGWNRAVRNVLKDTMDHIAGHLGAFAVLSSEGDIVGPAQIVPNLRPRKLHLPVPPRLARATPGNLLATQYIAAHPKISTWVSSKHTERLFDAYKELISRAADYVPQGATPRPWTVEPTGSYSVIHGAIQASGLVRVTTGRFDDNESGWKVPAVGTLYAFTDAIKPTEAEYELRTGETRPSHVSWQDL